MKIKKLRKKLKKIEKEYGNLEIAVVTGPHTARDGLDPVQSVVVYAQTYSIMGTTPPLLVIRA